MSNMYGDKICNNFTEILAGTNLPFTKAYMEAKSITADSKKSMIYLKKITHTIEMLSRKKGMKDQRISVTKGNLKQFSDYENMQMLINFLKKNLPNMKCVKDFIHLHDKILSYQHQYSEGYEKNNQLVILEYESAVYLLITAMVAVMNNHIEFVSTGTGIKVRKKEGNESKVIMTLVNDLLKELDNSTHPKYLEEILSVDPYHSQTDIRESVIMENKLTELGSLLSVILSDVSHIGKKSIRIVDSIRRSVFGIVPIIRSILYLKYKKKADTIVRLEEKIHFIKMNIEQLENRTNMDPKKKEEIIKQQQKYIEKYQKKSEKLKAELLETERDTEEAIKQNNEEISKTSSDDDDEFILEAGLSDFFESLNEKTFDQVSYKKVIEILAGQKFADKIESQLLSYPEKFLADPKNKDEIAQSCTNLYKDGAPVERFIYEIIIQRLSTDFYIGILNQKTSLDDFIKVIKKCIRKRDISSTEISKDSLQKSSRISDWVNLLNEQWESKKIMIAEISSDRSDYILFPCNIEDFNKLADYNKKTKFTFREFKDTKELKESSFLYESKSLKHTKKLNYLHRRSVSKSEIKQKREEFMQKKYLFPFLFKKKKKENQTKKDERYKKICSRIFNDFEQETLKKSIRLTLGTLHATDDKLHRTKTKFGGTPYFPASMEWPKDKYGHPMIMIAQLNFDELPRLENYPSSGLLQFFISDDDDAIECKIFYHTNLTEDQLSDIPITSCDKDHIEYFPFLGVFYPTAEIQNTIMNYSDENFDSTILAIANKYLEEPVEKWMSIDLDLREEIFKMMNKYEEGHTRIGGNPYFTHGDVRDSKYNELLLEIDSESGIMWGDLGIANFLINDKRLKDKKFDDVLFTWDCF